jgi:hypothetical protein
VPRSRYRRGSRSCGEKKGRKASVQLKGHRRVRGCSTICRQTKIKEEREWQEGGGRCRAVKKRRAVGKPVEVDRARRGLHRKQVSYCDKARGPNLQAVAILRLLSNMDGYRINNMPTTTVPTSSKEMSGRSTKEAVADTAWWQTVGSRCIQQRRQRGLQRLLRGESANMYGHHPEAVLQVRREEG